MPLPIGVPTAFIEPVDDPVGDLVEPLRPHARSVHGAGCRIPLRSGHRRRARHARRLAADSRVVDGEFRPGASGSEWCSVEVLRRLRSRSLAALRQEVEPVPQDALARFLPAVAARLDRAQRRNVARRRWTAHRSSTSSRASRCPRRRWETLVLPARLPNYSQAWLDELTASGEVHLVGSRRTARQRRLGEPAPRRHRAADPRRSRPATRPPSCSAPSSSALAGGGAYFFRQLAQAVAAEFATPVDDRELAAALWELVWAAWSPTTRSLPCARTSAHAKGTGGRAGPGTRRSATRAYRTRGGAPVEHPRRRPAERRAVDGRCSRSPKATRRCAPRRWASCCSNGTGSSPAGRS